MRAVSRPFPPSNAEWVDSHVPFHMGALPCPSIARRSCQPEPAIRGLFCAPSCSLCDPSNDRARPAILLLRLQRLPSAGSNPVFLTMPQDPVSRQVTTEPAAGFSPFPPSPAVNRIKGFSFLFFCFCPFLLQRVARAPGPKTATAHPSHAKSHRRNNNPCESFCLTIKFLISYLLPLWCFRLSPFSVGFFLVFVVVFFVSFVMGIYSPRPPALAGRNLWAAVEVPPAVGENHSWLPPVHPLAHIDELLPKSVSVFGVPGKATARPPALSPAGPGGQFPDRDELGVTADRGHVLSPPCHSVSNGVTNCPSPLFSPTPAGQL